MLFGSLFSGIGGLDLGLERAGMQCAWQVEIDPFCRRILERHWPDVERFSDVRECSRENLSPVDIISGGFPCQPVSYAGKRHGAMDDRWLWPEFYRIIRELEPRWVLVENVPGLLSVDSGRLFAGILRELAGRGYDAEWNRLPAAAFGAPHLRWRLFVVAYTRGERQQEQRELPRRISQTAGGSEAIAHPGSGGCKQREPELCGRESDTEGSGGDVAHTVCERRSRRPRIFKAAEQTGEFPAEGSDAWWAIEPAVGRMAHGVPDRMDRLGAIGSSVVPQVAEWLGRRIMEADRAR